MEERLISLETAKLAKEKGFNETTSKYWAKEYQSDKEFIINKDYMTHKWNSINKPIWSAPTLLLLQKWIWEKHTIWVQAQPLFNANECMGIHVTITSWKFLPIEVDYNGWDVYEGLEKGLQQALKLI